MARGRMITNHISRDRAIHQLSDDLSRLSFTWLITFTDCEGRVFGDPAIIRSALFPRRDDITLDQMTAYITEWANAGLIVWYEFQGDQWIYFPKFEKNQPGLRKEREPSSDIPAYSADTCRIIAGKYPDECPVKLIKENGMEWNGMEQVGENVEISDTFTKVSKIMPYKLKEWNAAAQQLRAAGVTPEEIEIAYQKMEIDQLTCSGLWSILQTSIWVHAQHTSGKPINLQPKNGKGYSNPSSNQPIYQGQTPEEKAQTDAIAANWIEKDRKKKAGTQ